MSSTENSTVISQQSPDVRRNLERKLSLRPEKQELVERNILKDSTIAPALQAAQAELERSQLEVGVSYVYNMTAHNLTVVHTQDKLDRAIRDRPKPEELVREGILKEDDAPLSP